MHAVFSGIVPVLTVFFQGVLSFFSPCVLPLLPVFAGYLSGGAAEGPDGNLIYPRRKILLGTLFFVLGVSFAFFLLGFGFTAAGRALGSHKVWLVRVSGVIMILFGLVQFGLLGENGLLAREHRLPLHLERWRMNPITALVFGFTFSFAWTPCVGPALSGVLLMASSSDTAARGYLLVGVYTLGFALPFLAVGLFTGFVLDFFKKHRQVVRYTSKIGAVLLIFMGLMTALSQSDAPASSPAADAASSQSSAASSQSSAASSSGEEAPDTGAAASEGATSSASSGAASSADSSAVSGYQLPPEIDFTLTDQYGNEHTLSDYAGQTVLLNFWATWCGPCQQEMPTIEALYNDYGKNEEDLVVLGIANPKTDERPLNQDVTQPEIEQHLAAGGYTFPTLMDTTGEVLSAFGISAFPTTFFIAPDGQVYGYVPGALAHDDFVSLVDELLARSAE